MLLSFSKLRTVAALIDEIPKVRMKAKNIRYAPDGGAEIVEINIEDRGSDEIQVKNDACGICSWDIQTFRTGSDSTFAAPPTYEGVEYVSKIGKM